MKDPREELPLLRDAFVLPFCWTAVDEGLGNPRGEGTAKLPPSVAKLAQGVVRQLRGEFREVAEKDWELKLASPYGLDREDLSWMPLEEASGWAALAAGLIVAARGGGGKPDPRVWATGAWSDGGIVPVGDQSLPGKVGLAVEFGARKFFVPEDQKPAAEAWVQGCGATLEIGAVEGGRNAPRSRACTT